MDKDRLNSIFLPGVAPKAPLAPVKVKSPPSFKNLAATDEAITDVTTLCFHVSSQFLAKSGIENTVFSKIWNLRSSHN